MARLILLRLIVHVNLQSKKTKQTRKKGIKRVFFRIKKMYPNDFQMISPKREMQFNIK